MRNAGSPTNSPQPGRDRAASTGAVPDQVQRPTMPASQSSLSVSPSFPPRSQSHSSLYSNYSYYAYDGQAISPSSSTQQLSPPIPSPTIAIHPPSPSQDDLQEAAAPRDPLKNPQTAQDYLQLGIQHHLANRLNESATCFEKSATIGGGCGMGMLMWGLAQRHGWGCQQSETKGFRWLRKAAELAVGDLERKQTGVDTGAIKVR